MEAVEALVSVSFHRSAASINTATNRRQKQLQDFSDEHPKGITPYATKGPNNLTTALQGRDPRPGSTPADAGDEKGRGLPARPWGNQKREVGESKRRDRDNGGHLQRFEKP
jgi:hypothetical protein